MNFDPEPLQALQRRYAEAWDAHDMELLKTIFTDDADWVDRAGIWMHGPQAISDGHGRVHSTIYLNTSITLSDGVFRLLSPDVVVGIIRWHVHGEVDWDGKTPLPTRHGIFTQVFVVRDDKWLIAACQSTLTPIESGGPDNSHAVFSQGRPATANTGKRPTA
ncbi:MAG TPA: SgcJ/EcaC family oxidoreductase [Candidatus Dormibacteraeota bacterium]|nr:SgcJ/EcaC family oxidoreductase [Candidatus Dormibacteraeota bacterium]